MAHILMVNKSSLLIRMGGKIHFLLSNVRERRRPGRKIGDIGGTAKNGRGEGSLSICL